MRHLLSLLLAVWAAQSACAATTVERVGGRWSFVVDGVPLAVRGAATGSAAPQDLSALKAAGATAVRTYSPDQAWALGSGLKVLMGLGMVPARFGWNYADPAVTAREQEHILAFVAAHKADKAVLAWIIGNEVEMNQPDPRVAWAAADAIAAAVKRLDPDHPTVVVVSDAGPDRLGLAAAALSHVDVLGINSYGGAALSVSARLAGDKPVLLAEWGALGQWQAGTKPWGAPVEPTSSEKAATFRDLLPKLAADPRLVGVFTFLWGAKQETTETWHGLLLRDGSVLGMVDAMAEAWGAKPRGVPLIKGIGIAADAFAPGAEVSAGVDAVSPAGRTLTFDWTVRRESTAPNQAGDEEPVPPLVLGGLTGPTVHFPAPGPGAYRLFLVVRDGTGGAATANMAFLVK